MRVLNDLMLTSATTIALSQASDVQPLDHIMVADLTATIASATPSGKTFAAADVNIVDNTATIAAHGFTTGLKIQVSNPGTLPTGLVAVTDYYLIVVDANTIKFASSQANALAGTAIDITNAGAGTNTITVNATIAGTIKLQKNNEPYDQPPIWFDIASASQVISAAGVLNFELTNKGLGEIGYRSLRALVTVTSGAITVSLRVNGKGV